MATAVNRKRRGCTCGGARFRFMCATFRIRPGVFLTPSTAAGPRGWLRVAAACGLLRSSGLIKRFYSTQPTPGLSVMHLRRRLWPFRKPSGCLLRPYKRWTTNTIAPSSSIKRSFLTLTTKVVGYNLRSGMAAVGAAAGSMTAPLLAALDAVSTFAQQARSAGASGDGVALAQAEDTTAADSGVDALMRQISDRRNCLSLPFPTSAFDAGRGSLDPVGT